MKRVEPGPGARDPELGGTRLAAGVVPFFADPRRHGACILACMHWTAAVSIAMSRPARDVAGVPVFRVPAS